MSRVHAREQSTCPWSSGGYRMTARDALYLGRDAGGRTEILGRQTQGGGGPRWQGHLLPNSSAAPQPQRLTHPSHVACSLHPGISSRPPSPPTPQVPALLVGHTAPGRPSDPDSRPLCPQEKRIASLDAANARLMSALTQLKERYSMQARNGISPTNPTKLQITENGEFRNSSNC